MRNYLLMIAFAVGLVVAGAIGLQVDRSKDHFMSASLIHRDSPMSPFYNSSKSQAEILGEAVTRSLDRINYMKLPMHIDAVDIQSVIIYNLGDYLMKINTGEEELLVMILMGAAFTWIYCDSSADTKDRLASYKMLSPDSMDCLISPNTNPVADAQGSEEICHYETSYPNNAVSKGVVSQATFHSEHSDGTEARFSLMFGCSHNFIGVPFKGPVQGIIGLGYGDFPFVSQIASQFVGMKEKISYCLPPYHSEDSVKIIFGEKTKNAVISNEERVTLPFKVKTNSAYYYLTLQTVSYDAKFTNYLTYRHNMVLESGMAMTTLDAKIFRDLMKLMMSVIPGPEFRVRDPENKFNFCYDKKDETTFKGFEMQFHFEGGILTLREENIFAKHKDNLKCMMIKPTNDDFMVLGNYAQINHIVEFDLNNNQISLVRANCVEELGI